MFFGFFLLVAGVIGFQLLNPIIKPHRYSALKTEWIITFSIISILTIYFIFYKRFVSIAFDHLRKKLTLTTTTLIKGIKMSDYNYPHITFKNGKEPTRFKGKKVTEFIEIHIKTKKLIKLEREIIGASSFDNILKECPQLNNHNQNTAHNNRFCSIGAEKYCPSAFVILLNCSNLAVIK